MNYLSDKYKWSAHCWNKYRTYLMILFNELSEYDAVESNFVRDISKRKTIKKVRAVLSEDERKKVREYLIKNNYRFWLFVNMFFHSGARISEFFRMKIADVDIENQTLKVTIKKGKQAFETLKPIKDIAVPFWKEYLQGFNNKKFFLMGEGLYPAENNTIYDFYSPQLFFLQYRFSIR